MTTNRISWDIYRKLNKLNLWIISFLLLFFHFKNKWIVYKRTAVVYVLLRMHCDISNFEQHETKCIAFIAMIHPFDKFMKFNRVKRVFDFQDTWNSWGCCVVCLVLIPFWANKNLSFFIIFCDKKSSWHWNWFCKNCDYLIPNEDNNRILLE